ncbi:hypothetical protein POTOM_057284 [Populus tomentosa]|uniref:Lactoylglutathione lyase n=1 Tax=Populus tomentosa TaxID=118781 RepID=A0A8X8C3R2_POPTO|nr:hypothetical protein POTOM_057284 [Populus tomentosa]
MASSTIRPSSASSLFRLCNTTNTCAASLVSLNPSSRRFPYLASAVPQSHFFGLRTSSKIWRGENRSITAGNMAQSNTAASLLEWVKKDKRRMLHVVYRVGDLDRTIKFYTECLGMKLLRKRDIPEERYANAFLGYGPEDSHFVIELTYNYGVDSYDIGTGFGHFGIAVEDVAKIVELIKAKGGKVTREPGPVKGGSTVIAFIEDPDGYKFELLERGPTPEPLCQVMLRVGDLDRSINFYEKAFGMELLRKRDNPEYKCVYLVPREGAEKDKTFMRSKSCSYSEWEYSSCQKNIVLHKVSVDDLDCSQKKVWLAAFYKYTIAMMGYGPEDKNAVLELTYNYGVTEYDKGNAYAQIAIGTDDVYKTAEAVKLFGGKVTREPGPLPGISTKITACLDPDGWKTVFVDNIDFLKELE